MDKIDPVLASALFKAQGLVETALKTKFNSQQKYSYAPAEEIMVVASEALQKVGLAALVIEAQWKDAALQPEVHGGAIGVIAVKLLVIHQESGANLIQQTDVPVCPVGGRTSGWARPADKSLFASRTEALGYALRDLLLIPREDVNDVSGRDERQPRRAEAPIVEPAPGPAAPSNGDPVAAARQLLEEANSLTSLTRALAKALQGLTPQQAGPIESYYLERVSARVATLTAEKLPEADAVLSKVTLQTKALQQALDALRTKTRGSVAAAMVDPDPERSF